MVKSGYVVQINLSKGGVPKYPVPLAQITSQGAVGDSQRNWQVHGGPDRALCLWSLEVIQTLQQAGHPIQPGAAGENITIAGLDWETVVPDLILQIGTTLQVKVTDYAPPCRQIMKWFADHRFSRISQTHYPGSSRVYARVLGEGIVRPGDQIRIQV